MKLYFVTGNKGKYLSLKRRFELSGRNDVELIQKDLDIIETQSDTVEEVSKYKALEAYEILKAPLIVEDGGFFIDALGGFPGVYTKYILGTIGIEGLLKLLTGEKNRKAKFDSFVTYIDEFGEIHQFQRDNIEYEIGEDIKNIDKTQAWSDLWKIVYVKKHGKYLCEFTKEDFDKYNEEIYDLDSMSKFFNWFISK